VPEQFIGAVDKVNPHAISILVAPDFSFRKGPYFLHDEAVRGAAEPSSADESGFNALFGWLSSANASGP
jgi:hypothetical protein